MTDFDNFNINEEESQESQAKNLLEEVDVGLLIEAVQNYEYLYNMSHKDYKDQKKKNLAWSEVGIIMNLTTEQCIKMWKLLRDRFVKEKNKTPSGSQAPESSWVYFKNMSFYAKYTKPRKTFTSTSKASGKVAPPVPSTSAQSSRASSRASSASSIWSSIETETILSPKSVEPGELAEDIVEQPTVVVDVTPTSSKSKAAKASTTKRKQNQDDEFLNIAKKISKTMDSCNNQKEEKTNPNLKFTEYVYSRLSEMSAEEARAKRRQMLLLLEDVE